MKKSMGVYSVIFAICLAAFNVIVFVTPNVLDGAQKFSDSFWVGYVGITLAFLAQLACGLVACKASHLQKLFYNISLISVSYSGLIAMLIAGGVWMAIPTLPEWIGVVVCVLILAANVIAIIKAAAAAKIVSGTDEKIKAQTRLMKDLALNAQALMSAAQSDGLQQEAKKVYEALRYGDPVANGELCALEGRIKGEFVAFSDAVVSGDLTLAKENASTLLALLEKRNQSCRLHKNG